jgi:hypothetical protein
LFIPAFDRFYVCLLFVDEATCDGQSFSVSTKPTVFTVSYGAKEIKELRRVETVEVKF